jgi:hypothetical protein
MPTPTAGDAKSARNSTANRSKLPPTGIHAGDTLTDYVTKWPTPTARDWKDTGDLTGVPENSLLPRVVARVEREQWATPTAHPRTHTPRQVDHGEQLANQAGGALNPTWVEWLMGFPLGWTDCGPSETRSSRRSRSGSAGESSTTKRSG